MCALVTGVMSRQALMTRSAESLTDLMKLVFSDVLEFVRVQEQLYTKASIEVESQRAATAAARDRTKAVRWLWVGRCVGCVHGGAHTCGWLTTGHLGNRCGR